MKNRLLIVFCLLFSLLLTYDNANAKSIKNESYPDFASLCNWGLKFSFSVPPCNEEYAGMENYVRVYLLSFDTAQVTLKAKSGYVVNRTLYPYIPVEIELTPEIAQAYVKKPQDAPPASTIYKNSAISIESDELISVSVLVDYFKSGDSFLVFPEDLLGKNYIVSSYESDSGSMSNNFYPSEFFITSTRDNTSVTIDADSIIFTNIAIDFPETNSITKKLNKGDVWAFSTKSRTGDLSGVSIKSSEPVAVTSGSQCAYVPAGIGPCDYLAEMLVPLEALGSSAIVPNFAGRRSPSLIRAYSTVNANAVKLNGVEQGVLNKSGSNKTAEFVEFRNSLPAPGVVTAESPLQVSVYNTGVSEDGNPAPIGGPCLLNATSTNNYQKEILFYAPVTAKSNSSNFINLIFASASDFSSIYDTEIEYFENGAFTKAKLSDYSVYSNQNIDGKTDGLNFQSITMQLNNTGVYKIKSIYPFASYLYGFSENMGYAHQASLALKRKQIYDTLAPKVTFVLDCGNAEGVAIDKPDDPAVRSNLAEPIYSSVASYNYDFIPNLSGDASQLTWKLQLRQPIQDAHAEITFRDKAGNDTLIIVDYKAPRLELYPKSYSFGSVRKGATVTKEFTITNTSKAGFLLKTVKIFDPTHKFSIIGFTPDSVLAPGGSTTFTVQFVADSAGVFSGRLIAETYCNLVFFVLGDITAKVGVPDIQVDDVNMGSIVVNSTHKYKLYAKNAGKADLQITGFKPPNSADIKLKFAKTPDKTNPVILSSGSGMEFELEYSPKTEGALADSIVFYSDATISDSVCYIKSNNIAPGLSAKSYDWNRKKANRINFPNGPYESENGELAVENLGSAALTIASADIEFARNIDLNSFEINKAQFVNLSLGPQEKYLFTAKFAPKDTGEFSIQIKFKDGSGNTAYSTLKGIGIAPTYSCDNVDLGAYDPKLSETPITGKVVIHNNSNLENPYADTLRIFNIFKQTLDSAIKINQFGTKGFKIIYSGPDSVKLAPGEDLALNVEFATKELIKATAQFCPVSDAINNVCSELKALSSYNKLSFTGADYYNACLGDTTLATLTLKNAGITTISANGISLEPISDEFTLLTNDAAKPFKINPGETKEIRFIYSPKDLKTITRSIRILGADSKALDTILIRTEAKFIERSPYLKPVNQRVAIGDKVELSLYLSEGIDISFAGINSAKISVSFTNDFLVAIPERIYLNEDFAKDFKMTGLQINNNSIEFSIQSITGKSINSAGEIAHLGFDVIAPSKENLFSEVASTISVSPAKCVALQTSQALIELAPYCASKLSHLKSSGVNYSLKVQNNSPIIDNNLKIELGVGISAPTLLSIINSNGEVVARIINEYLTYGEYLTNYNTSALSSGVYFVRYESGPFSETQKILIIK